MVMACVAATLVMSGCFRKHISSTPPAARPAHPVKVEPAAKPAPAPVKEEKLEIIEDTIVVNAAPEEKKAVETVKEGDLGAEEIVQPKPEPEAEPVKEVAKVEKEPKAAEPTKAPVHPEDEVVDIDGAVVVKEAKTASTPTEPAIMGEMYYVQIGAFSELENANNVLAGLLDAGYKGSKLSKSPTGLYRVQAGAFTDMDEAEASLNALKSDYPKAFVLKDMPE